MNDIDIVLVPVDTTKQILTLDSYCNQHISRSWVNTYWSVYQRLWRLILCVDLSNTCVDTYWTNSEKFKILIFMCRSIRFMCRSIRFMCRRKISKNWKFWHLWIWNDFGILNFTHAWLIDERLIHMIVFHDFLANNMQTHKYKYEMVKYIDKMWRHLEWGHYKHVKWNTWWLSLKKLEMNTYNMYHT